MRVRAARRLRAGLSAVVQTLARRDVHLQSCQTAQLARSACRSRLEPRRAWRRRRPRPAWWAGGVRVGRSVRARRLLEALAWREGPRVVSRCVDAVGVHALQ